MREIVSTSNQRLRGQASGLTGAASPSNAEYVLPKTGVSGVTCVSHGSKCPKTLGCGIATPCSRCIGAQVYQCLAVYQPQQAFLACWPLEKGQPRGLCLAPMGRGI